MNARIITLTISSLMALVLCQVELAADELHTKLIDLAASGMQIHVGPPLVVALSEPGEQRWGHHQFPKLSRLPKGDLLLTLNRSADDGAAYGHAGPAYVSHDEGASWDPYEGTEKAITISHSPISSVDAGEFLCLPHPTGIDVRKISGMPKSVREYTCYAKRNYYQLADCPSMVQTAMSDLVAYRWKPAEQAWRSERLTYDLHDALVWTSEQSNGSILSRTSFEYPLLAGHGNLYCAEYKFRYLRRDGSVPRGMVVTCMASRDGGRTFERRGTIAEDPSGQDQPSETALALTSDGSLVAVGRTSCGNARPLWIAFSKDEGHTWSPTRPLISRGEGVMPVMIQLETGALALVSGRPGVWLSISPDGRGTTWTTPLNISRTDEKPGALQSCGYTGIVNLAANQFLLAYSDFEVPDEEGQVCKAIVVRRIKLAKTD